MAAFNEISSTTNVLAKNKPYTCYTLCRQVGQYFSCDTGYYAVQKLMVLIFFSKWINYNSSSENLCLNFVAAHFSNEQPFFLLAVQYY